MKNYDYKKDKADFVYDILCNRVPDEFIVKGMIYWYFYRGWTIGHLHDEMHYHSNGFYKPEDIISVLTSVTIACRNFIDIDDSESGEEIEKAWQPIQR